MAKKITITLEVTRMVAIHTRTCGPECDERAAELEPVVAEKSEFSAQQSEAPESWLTRVGLHWVRLWNQWSLVSLRSLLAGMRKPKPR